MDVVEIELEIESEDGCCVSKRAKVSVSRSSAFYLFLIKKCLVIIEILSLCL